MQGKSNENENENEDGKRWDPHAKFDHEKLEVYQTALRFIEWRGGILGRFPPTHYLVDQLDRASSSITFNIAEGAGEWARADRTRFYRIARRSATECSAILDVVQARRLEPKERMTEGKELIHRVIAMLTALARSNRTP